MTNVRLELAVRFADDVRSLSSQPPLPAAEILLATAELGLDSKAIRARIDRLLADGPLYEDENHDLLFPIVRQLVFTRYGVHEGSRREFLRYWIEEKRFRDRETIDKSFLMNFACENRELLPAASRALVERWFVDRLRYKATRAMAWAVYQLAHLGHVARARAVAEELLLRRQENGSWDDDARRTIDSAFALVRSTVITREELALSQDYVLARVHRGLLEDVLVRSSLVKFLYRMEALGDEHLTLIRSRIRGPSIFLSHSTHDDPFVRRLADDLGKHGIRAWVDDAEIRAGESLFDKIESALHEMEFLGVVLSERSVTSEWVGREITMRLTHDLARRGAAVIPIILDDCDVKLGLRGLPSVDFRGSYDQAMQRLVHMITAPTRE